ncbi:hypothetical protein ACUWHX_001724, partial [Campylobacter upsaliensis]
SFQCGFFDRTLRALCSKLMVSKILMTPYLKAMYFMALFINASNDFLGYKRAMKVSKKELTSPQ